MLNLKNINVSFDEGANKKQILKNLNLTIPNNTFCILIGKNGAGKSTLLKALSGNLKINSGSILVDGVNLLKPVSKNKEALVTFMMQDSSLSTFPNLTVEENMIITYKKMGNISLNFAYKKDRRDYFAELLKIAEIGLEDKMSITASNLSGGQRQILSLIMSTMHNSKILLLDEITASLDPKSAEKIMDITHKIVKKNKIIAIMTTHNMQYALKYSDLLIVLSNGEIAFSYNQDQLKNLSIIELISFF